jgi:dihydrofolate reductase
MTNFVYIATSLDGYIADRDGKLDWLEDIPNPDQSDFGYEDFMKGIDAVLMGRITFEKALTFNHWPYEKPVFVVSTRLKKVPTEVEGKVTLLDGDLEQLAADMEARGFHHLYIDGGKTIQSFLKNDLIDVMIITTVPVLLGGGTRLFGDLIRPLKFRHQKTMVYNDFLVKSIYTRIR